MPACLLLWLLGFQGAFANVHVAHDKALNKRVALKEIHKGNPTAVASPMGEFILGKMLRNEFLVHTIECIDTRNTLFISLELANGGDLFTLLDPSGPGLIEQDGRQAHLSKCAVQREISGRKRC